MTAPAPDARRRAPGRWSWPDRRGTRSRLGWCFGPTDPHRRGPYPCPGVSGTGVVCDCPCHEEETA